MDVVALPEAPLWALPLADTRSPLSSVTLRGDLGDPDAPGFGKRIEAAIAADFPVIGVGQGALSAGLGVSAATFLGFSSDGEITFGLRTFDGLFGFPIDAAWGPLSARLQWAHLSAHYGDGIRKEPRDTLNPDPYSREYVQLQVGGDLLGHARVYGGGRLVTHGTPEVPPLGLQVGGEVWGPWPIAPYAAVDLKIAAEDAWSPAVAAQLGAWMGRGRYRFRVAGTIYDGPDDTGKWNALEETWVGLLFGFDGTGGRSAGAAEVPEVPEVPER